MHSSAPKSQQQCFFVKTEGKQNKYRKLWNLFNLQNQTQQGVDQQVQAQQIHRLNQANLNKLLVNALALTEAAHENETRLAVPSCHGRRCNQLNTHHRSER